MPWFRKIWSHISLSNFITGVVILGVLALCAALVTYSLHEDAVWESQHAQIRFGEKEDQIIEDLLGKEIRDRWVTESPEEIKSIRILSSERRYKHWHTVIVELVLQELGEKTTHYAKVELVYDRRENLRCIRELEWIWEEEK